MIQSIIRNDFVTNQTPPLQAGTEFTLAPGRLQGRFTRLGVPDKADITNPASSPLELQAIMPDYMIPFVPIIQQGEKPFSMFQDLNQKYGAWVLKVLEYDSADNLIEVLGDAVVRCT
jgi:hypothetical protein